MNYHLRIARSTNNFEEIKKFYKDGVGFEIIGSFKGHDGFDGIMFGSKDSCYHLEFTKEKKIMHLIRPPKRIFWFFTSLIKTNGKKK
jgi:hypothetical protein